ncbi:hypothetical protein [Geobacter grbiciae]|uniref:hypothetical protein n=1 Tax=Geobacter grbiciae TaxID=155042 RepID=UPI001C02B57E|nr:hypothetical protein [Geobacter grbiciae]MBT1074440.1 hypothetical protein [Geobacter grbiciae]
MTITFPDHNQCQTVKTPNTNLFYRRIAAESFPACTHAILFGDDVLCLHPCNHLYAR